MLDMNVEWPFQTVKSFIQQAPNSVQVRWTHLSPILDKRNSKSAWIYYVFIIAAFNNLVFSLESNLESP